MFRIFNRLFHRLFTTVVVLVLLMLIVAALAPTNPMIAHAREVAIDGIGDGARAVVSCVARGGESVAGWAANRVRGNDSDWLSEFDGVIDWGDGVIRVTGHGALPQTATSYAQARLMARGAAELDAERQLAGMLNGARIYAHRQLEQHIQSEYTVEENISAWLRGAHVIAEREGEGGNVEVDMEIRLQVPGTTEVPETVEATDETRELVAVIEPVVSRTTAFQPNPTRTSGWQQSSYYEPHPPRDGYTGLIINATNADFEPAILPEILNEYGDSVLAEMGHEIDLGELRRAPIAYVYSIEEARDLEDMGNHPMIVDAQGTPQAGASTLVIAQADVDRLLTTTDPQALLSTGRVAVVVDLVK